MGRLGADVPSLNAQICYTGVKLETLGSLIPTGTRTTLNANGFDARLSLSLDEKAVNLYGTVTSDAGIRYDAIHIQGPLKAPKVEMGPVVAGVFSQVSGDMLNLGKGGLEKSVSSLSGDDETARAWDQGIADRHRAAMQQARSALAQMPYPPVTE
jgi:hypothetical protein